MGCGGSKETVAVECKRSSSPKPPTTKKPDDPKAQISEEFSTTFPETIYKADMNKQEIHAPEETKKPTPSLVSVSIGEPKKEEKVLPLKYSADEKDEQEAEVDEKEEEKSVTSDSTETTTTAMRIEETKMEAKIEEEIV